MTEHDDYLVRCGMVEEDKTEGFVVNNDISFMYPLPMDVVDIGLPFTFDWGYHNTALDRMIELSDTHTTMDSDTHTTMDFVYTR